MSHILKLNANNWLNQRLDPYMFSLGEEELLSNIKRPSLSSISVSDSNKSDASSDRITLDGGLTFSEQKALEFSLSEPSLKVEEPEAKICCIEVPLRGNVECGQLKKFNMDKPLCIDNSLKKENKQKSVSLHDISSLSSLLNTKADNYVSSETLHSHSLSSTTKSKDSGIHRSISCLSLTSGNRSYDHVQSKVKEYIRNIKESEAQRKKNHSQSAQSIPNKTPLHPIVVVNPEESENLKKKIFELESELKEKSVLLDTQQEQYNALLYKYAEAKIIIDTVRLRGMSISAHNTTQNESIDKNCLISSRSFGSYSTSAFNSYFNSSTVNNNKEVREHLKFDSVCENCTSDSSVPSFPEHSTPISSPVKIQNLLGPVSRIFSSSSRLDKQFVPLSKLETSKKSKENECQTLETISNEKESRLKSSNMSCSIDNSCLEQSSFKMKDQQIDLPKDAPFDKVKKWQESLPSIDLLGSCSSSVSDASVTDLNTVNPEEIIPTRTVIRGKQTKNKIAQEKHIKKLNEHGFNNKLNLLKHSKSLDYGNQQEEVEDKCLILPLSNISISKKIEYCKNHKSEMSCNEQNNNLCNMTSHIKLKSRSDQFPNCEYTSEKSFLSKCKNPGLEVIGQESDKISKTCSKIVVSVDETTSDDELPSYFPFSSSSAFSVSRNVKQLVKSDDSSSVSSSVLDSMNELYNFVQKKSPKRKVNCLNYYSPCKIAKLKETSEPSNVTESNGPKQQAKVSRRILRESKLNHLFPSHSTNTNVTKKFQSVDKTGDIWWKNKDQTNFKTSKNLQECLNHAEYFANIISDGLKRLELTLDRPAKIL